MKCKSIRMACAAAALLALASCTQDELAEQGTALPYGEYPLEISGVTLDVESGSELWSAKAPQTRVSENADGNSSTWTKGDIFYVKTAGAADENAGTYTYNGTDWEQSKITYWTKTIETVTAWYPENGDIDLADQSGSLKYVLQAVSEDASYNNDINLAFHHKLAKVRVKLDGITDKSTNVEIYSYTQCTNQQGNVTGTKEDWITAGYRDYEGGVWEANVVPEKKITKFRVNGTESTLSNFTPKEGKINTLTIDVAKEINIKDITEDEYTVEGNVVLKGDGNEHILKLTVSDGANLTLEGVKLKGKTNENVIEVVDGSATLTFSGENEIKPDYWGIGVGYYFYLHPIYVSGKNATLTIGGKSDTDKLTVNAESVPDGVGICGAEGGNIVINSGTIIATGGSGGAAIGGNCLSECGNITINGGNIMANAGINAAAIGAGTKQKEGDGGCGDITINGGTVTANGNTDTSGLGSAGIGCGVESKCGAIIISGGNITANGGYYGAGIGSAQGATSFSTCGKITISGGKITAIGGEEGAGIGCADGGECEAIVISGGEIIANGGNHGAGIGSANTYSSSKCGEITIRSGKITATGGNGGAGIGSGYKGICTDISISGGNIIAKGKENATNGSAGIGGGFDAKCGNITISGGEIYAEGGTSEYGGTGIGTFSGINTSSNLTITGGTVTAIGKGGTKGSGAGLGAGPTGKWGNITISGSKTVVKATGGGDAYDIGPGTNGATCGTVTISPKAGVTATNNKIYK